MSRVHVDVEEFSWVPGSPFCYWVSSALRRLFSELPSLEAAGASARQGLATANDFRFARSWWAVDPAVLGVTHFPLSKGGPYSLFYADLDLVVNWSDSGAEMKCHSNTSDGKPSAAIRNEQLYFTPGITWPLRSGSFCPQALPAGAIISTRGSGIFSAEPGVLLGMLASSTADYILKLLSGRLGYPQFDMGDIAVLPAPPTWAQEDGLGLLARRGWSLRRALDTANEVSHAFVVPALFQVAGDSLAHRVRAWAEHVAEVEAELARVRRTIDELCFDLYGITSEDRRSIADGFGAGGTSEVHADDVAMDDEDSAEPVVELNAAGLAAGLVSWAVGVVVGRFDVRMVTGDRAWPAEPDPFDPLPVLSPGMLPVEDRLQQYVAERDYPLPVLPLLVDDPGHELDICARVRAVVDVALGEGADEWWTALGSTLDPKTGEVDCWLKKSFFDHHLKTHSKSRRRAPIMWPLGTRSGSYRVWLFAHRVTTDSLFRVLNDLVVPKVQVEERRLSDLRQESRPSPSASQRKAIDAQETYAAELREFRDELAAVAPLWAPDLNDGVVIVLAPLWRLFAHHRAWSNELRDHWQKLAAGEYDWSQLAMRLWPERVIPKCAEDRSLAIAHGLEDVFWVADKDNSGRWKPRAVPKTPVEELIAAHTNPTVTAARQHPTP